MRITQEADYALRIAYLLACNGGVLDAGTISQSVGVSDRFTVKILRKLIGGGVVCSKKGVNGGYALAESPKDISMLRVVELIDGPIEISRCLSSEYECSRNGEKKHECTFHLIFSKLNKALADKLDSVTLDTVIHEDFDVKALLKTL